MRRAHLTSLKNKLALVFFAIIALAFAVIFFYVVPQLESSLESQKLRDLERVAAASTGAIESVIDQDVTERDLNELVRAVADSADAQVTLLGIQRSGGPPGNRGRMPLYVISDSRAGRRVSANWAVATRAVASGRLETGISSEGGEELGQAAEPLEYRGSPVWVAVFSRSLADVSATVTLIRTQVLVASGVGLLLALAGGYLVAGALARRVRRLEDAAKQVAAGRFIEPLPIDSDDELGQLTRTFNEMQQQLARVDRARKEFIANASHELRTPIFSLGGFVELLQDEDLDRATREEFLQAMGEQVQRLQKLAVDLLDLSRLDAGSLQLSTEDVDIADLAREVVGEFKPAVSQHGTDLELKLPEEGVESHCDPERVAQVMRILLDNALRHTPEGTHVTVTADRHNGVAELTVADRGPGLEDGADGQVFERFYTADAARGSGLGLAIAKELAEHMRGDLRLSVRPGETAFTLVLPPAGEPEGS